MAKLPGAPSVARLREISPHIAQLPAGRMVWRVYFRSGPHPQDWSDFRWWGPAEARFDHHLPPPGAQERGILHAAASAQTCLAFVFQARRTINVGRRDPWLVSFSVARAIRLLDLTRQWPTRAGASMALSSGPRPRAREWSRAIYEAYPTSRAPVPSSMDGNRTALAWYERARSALPERPELHRSLADPALRRRLLAAAERLGYRLVSGPAVGRARVT